MSGRGGKLGLSTPTVPHREDSVDENSELIHGDNMMSQHAGSASVSFFRRVEEYSVAGEGQAPWLQVPPEFGRCYLRPGVDDSKTSCFLQNTNGDVWPVIYSSDGFYYGWASFAADNGLVVGDTVVFKPLEEHRFFVQVFSQESGMDKSMVRKRDPSRSTEAVAKDGALDIYPKPAFEGFKGCKPPHGSESGNKPKTYQDVPKLPDSDDDVVLLETVPADWQSTSKRKVTEPIDAKPGKEIVETNDVKGREGTEAIEVKGKQGMDVKGKEGIETNNEHVQHDYVLKHEPAVANNVLSRSRNEIVTSGFVENNAPHTSTDSVWECRMREQPVIRRINPLDIGQPSTVPLSVTPQTEGMPAIREEAQPPAKRKCGRPARHFTGASHNVGVASPGPYMFESRRRPVTPIEQIDAFASAHAFVSKMQKTASLVVVMRKTAVYCNFMMSIKKTWSQMYMPNVKKTVHLRDSQEKMQVCAWNPTYSYLAGAGWRDFALDHCLEEHDVLVMEIMSETITVITIMMHIFRVVPIRHGLTGWHSHRRL